MAYFGIVKQNGVKVGSDKASLNLNIFELDRFYEGHFDLSYCIWDLTRPLQFKVKKTKTPSSFIAFEDVIWLARKLIKTLGTSNQTLEIWYDFVFYVNICLQKIKENFPVVYPKHTVLGEVAKLSW